MIVAKALFDAWLRPASEADAIQRALAEQKRLDLFDIECQACGGLGVVEDLTNRFYRCPGMCPFQDEPGHEDDPEAHCPRCEMMYGAKRCPACDGLGSPRVG